MRILIDVGEPECFGLDYPFLNYSGMLHKSAFAEVYLAKDRSGSEICICVKWSPSPLGRSNLDITELETLDDCWYTPRIVDYSKFTVGNICIAVGLRDYIPGVPLSSLSWADMDRHTRALLVDQICKLVNDILKHSSPVFQSTHISTASTSDPCRLLQ